MDSLVGPIIGLVCIGLFAVIFTVVGIVLILRSRQDKAKMQQSLNWPSVDGTVIESRVMTTSDEEGSNLYRPYIKYEYEAGGIKQTNDKFSVGMVYSTSNMKKSQETVNRYPVGRNVKVYVNPANPAESTLEQKGSTTATLVIGIVLVVLGVCGGIPLLILMLASIFNITTTTGF